MTERMNPIPEQPQDPEAYPPTQEGFVAALDDTISQYADHIVLNGMSGVRDGQPIWQERQQLTLYVDKNPKNKIVIEAGDWSGSGSLLAPEGGRTASCQVVPYGTARRRLDEHYIVGPDGTVRDLAPGIPRPTLGKPMARDALESVDFGDLITRIRGASPEKPSKSGLAAKLGFIAGGRGRPRS